MCFLKKTLYKHMIKKSTISIEWKEALIPLSACTFSLQMTTWPGPLFLWIASSAMRWCTPTFPLVGSQLCMLLTKPLVLKFPRVSWRLFRVAAYRQTCPGLLNGCKSPPVRLCFRVASQLFLSVGFWFLLPSSCEVAAKGCEHGSSCLRVNASPLLSDRCTRKPREAVPFCDGASDAGGTSAPSPF